MGRAARITKAGARNGARLKWMEVSTMAAAGTGTAGRVRMLRAPEIDRSSNAGGMGRIAVARSVMERSNRGGCSTETRWSDVAAKGRYSSIK